MLHRLHKPLTCSLQLQLVLSTIIKMLLALQHGSTTAQCFSLACMRPVFNYVNQKKGHLQHHCQLQQIFLNSNTGAVGTISLLHFPYRPLGGIHFLRRQPRGRGRGVSQISTLLIAIFRKIIYKRGGFKKAWLAETLGMAKSGSTLSRQLT